MAGQDCVVDVETDRSESSVVDRFEHYARITGLYPWRPSKSSRQHYFVRYSRPDGVHRACRDSHPDFDVSALTSAYLVDRFIEVTTHGDPPLSSHTASPITPKASTRRQPQPAISTNQPYVAVSPTSALPTPPGSALDRDGSPYLPLPVRPVVLQTAAASDEDKENHDEELVVTQLVSTRPLQSAPPLPISLSLPSATATHPLIPTGMPSLQTDVVLSLCGERIKLDLNALDEDPSTVISLLKASASDCDLWMMVGATYRRRGNVGAAILVVEAMLDGEFMKDHGLVESDLKPGFLMLSHCQTELCKRSRNPDGTETEASLAHMDRSRRWLQRVYGTHVPEPEAPQAAALELVYTNGSAGSSREGNRGLPIAKAMRDVTELPPVRIRPRDVAATAESTLVSAPAPSSVTKTPVDSLQRDLQILRDRQATHVAELSSTRSAKRALEDECVHERTQRRKLERVLYDVEAQLAKAQRMEQEARELLRREIHERRRAEEIARQERELRIDAEERGRKDVRPLLEGLAGLFQRAAAQGDVSALLVAIGCKAQGA
ncbi:hypothetical protein FA95DRAFT_138562 [Auriscalpium vulgare]|uniref:Uncharacterized protein n=1 Tax=Auriscalpium vulgare TaxID=40419 RepID=A0ACB8S7M7_9AGAM|nr:hypothetical protein FA95DRAFT_138562 [Auriscalpium vulgare]